MESNKDEEKQQDLIEQTNEVQVVTTEKSEITLKTVKTSGKENTTSTSELKSVTETKTDGEVAQITLSTIHNIYKNNTDNTVSDTKEILLTRNNSSRKLNKAAYAKLHRKNSNPTHVGFLKNKYEDTTKKNGDDVNGNVKDNTSNKNDDKKGTTEKIDVSRNKEPQKTEIEEKSKTKENSDKNLNNKSNLSGSTNSIEKATANIEKLQRNLTVKLNKETVEKLRSKYSPASFGYPKTFSVTPKKVQFANEASPATKIPVPKPRVSIKPNSSFKGPNKPQEITTKSTVTETPKKELPIKETTKANEKLPNETVKPLKEETVQVTLISPEKPDEIYASTSTLTSTAEESPKDVNSNEIKNTNDSRDSILLVEYDEITFGEPEEQNFIIRRSSSEDSVKKVEHFFNDEITMERKPKEKKRSSSFRRMLSGSFFGSSKKKNEEDKKKNKKIENADNTQNENNAFQRNLSQRHTISNYPSRDIPVNRNYVNGNCNDKDLELEMRFAEMHINRFNQIKYNFNSGNESQLRHPQEDYVCMNNSEKKPSNYMNVSRINKYIDTSSSSSTLESEKPTNTYQNALIAQAELQQLRQNAKIKNNISNAPERFSETPPRAYDTCQNVQLVKPKALIPINSERPLPNPYHNGDREKNDKENNKTDKPKLDDVYGTVFDSVEVRRNRSLSPQTHSVPRSPSLESTKLKLPPNRERIELQPRIKSPIPQTRVSTDKIIATELLKNARSPTPTRKNVSPSHQKLEIDIDYPDNVEVVNKSETNVIAKPPQSPKKVIEQHLEAAEWQKKQKEIDQYPFAPVQNNQIVTNAVVHSKPLVQQQQKSPPNLVQQSRIPVSPSLQQMDRCITPVNQRIPLSPGLSPEKLEMRQSVEAWHWKELKKLKEQKEREEKELYYYQLQMSSYGYAEDPVLTRRSRSVSPSMQRAGGGRRSLSLPREMRNQKIPVTYQNSENVEGYVRLRQPESIPEGRAVMNPNTLYQTRPEYYYGQVNPNFIRNSPQRRTIGVINSQDLNQRPPIFKRGSLTQPQPEPLYQANKKVSFSSHQNSQSVWPTKNGFTQSPPQRRVEKRDSTLEDEVFLPNSPKLDNAPKRELVYGYLPPKTNAMHSQENFLRKHQNNEMVNDSPYGSTRQMNQQIRQQMIQQNPVYYSRQSLPDGPQNKTVTVTNKVCDFYGQIHNADTATYGNIQKTGVVYGQLQRNPVPSSPVVLRQNVPNCFVRGSRLTASANDMYKRYTLVDPRYRSDTVVFEPIYERRYHCDTPNRPLPPIPNERTSSLLQKNRFVPASDTESDTSEIQRIFRPDVHVNNRNYNEEEWNSDGKSGRGIVGNEAGSGRGDNDGEVRGRSRSARRDDPRRHTLGGDQQYTMAGQGGPLARTMDLEGQPRGYPPPSNAMLFDDDPGIMSEVETSSTGFRRGGKQRSSLPVVRTPSKTLERPLGLVFLQYRNETKRALLPNEITSIDTVKALFVRSFPKQLTMEYLDSPQVKIYIHDSSKDMFYELEDLRSHLREIRDRSVLRLFESADVSGGLPMAGIGIAGGVGHFEDPSYFSEPEFDSEYQHQHIHKSKGSAAKGAPYYMGSTASLPRGAALLRTYSPAVGALPADRLKTLPTGAPPKPQRAYSSGAPRSSDGPPRPPDRFAPFQRPTNSLFSLPDGYMSSPERGSRAYEDPYYSQYATRSGSITPVIDEEVSDTELLDDSYSLYGVKLPPGGPRAPPRSPFPPPAAVPYDATRLRVENMERQLANLTGLVQKALTQTPSTHLQVPSGRDGYRAGDEFDKNSSSSSTSLPDETYLRSDSKTPKLGKSSCHKSVSFEKSVSFSDEPPDMNSPKQHSPQHTADTKPPKPAIKSSTLPRTSSQERDRLKPAPPPKPASLSPGQYDGRHIYRDLQLTPEMYNQLRGLQKKAKDLRAEVRNLRRMSQAQAHSVRETIRDTFIKIRAMLLAGGEQVWQAGMDQEHVRLSREEDLYKQEMLRLEKDLSDLEATVEELRGNVINRKTRVNMSDVENMALILSKSSKTVADLKLRFPGLQDGMKAFLSSEMEKVVREEKFLKEEPERLESALRRCKKLTGTLVTLKRLASVQEQRLPCSTTSNDGRLSPNMTETPPVTPTSAQHSKSTSGTPRLGQIFIGGDSGNSTDSSQRPENALDALLDELQTFSKPHPSTVSTQMPQVSCQECTPSEPPAIPVKGIPPSHSSHFSHPPLMSEIGRKGSMDSATLLTQNLTVSTATGSLRRLHSYPSGSDTDNSPPIQPLQRIQVDSKTANKPPIPERNAELLQHLTSGRRVPPPPPPRTSSKSPLASPTSPSLPPRSSATALQHIQNVQNMVEKPQSQFETATQNLGLSTLRRNVSGRSSIKDKAQTLPRNIGSNLQVHTEGSDVISASNSSSCESVNSQDGSKKSTRKEELEQRHQELLKKQKALQEQYARLQQLQRGNNTLAVVPPAPDQLLKKTGSESNLLQKMGLQMTTTQMTGSLTNLPNTSTNSISKNNSTSTNTQHNNSDEKTTTNNTTGNVNVTTNKVYETDIL